MQLPGLHDLFPRVKCKTLFLKIITNYFLMSDFLQDMLAGVRIMNERVSLRSVDDLKMPCTWLTENRFGRHEEEMSA